MNASKLAIVSMAGALVLGSISTTASAQKTRDQVRQELLQAQHDGLVVAGKQPYPPTAETQARNKELHAITKHAGQTGSGFDSHDYIAQQ
ncbi:hypothetical protein LMG28614_02252 [Paraburkholderia ultramafica]|uniref:DUF4148 domain-containing protein n=1 Tax=Paraburkholderia ultramafica TaxID=1544867 RepID=A0A6S7B3A1_9BURK|nr:DUF4148 domain-containing protein [Paraburkholderia ultramafica]CAB3786201.1 hypothetical protein LMG28614_02252 [Paraburkholderia ultramafica]